MVFRLAHDKGFAIRHARFGWLKSAGSRNGNTILHDDDHSPAINVAEDLLVAGGVSRTVDALMLPA